MTPAGSTSLSLLERELERRGLLLQHDRTLPSVTTLVVGAPVSGSWWGHARGKEIYALLLQLEQGAGALSVKLINGKVTFIHRRLWPALLCVVQKPALIERCPLSSSALALYAEVARRGSASVPQLNADGVAPAKALASALRELERSVLVHVDSEHGESGAHHKRLSSWRWWMSRHSVQALSDGSEAFAELEAAARALSERGGSARLPWPAAEPR